MNDQRHLVAPLQIEANANALTVPVSLSLHQAILEMVTMYKYLGLLISNHTQGVCSKAKKILGTFISQILEPGHSAPIVYIVSLSSPGIYIAP